MQETHPRLRWPPVAENAWHLVFPRTSPSASISGAVYVFPDGETFTIGQRIDLGEGGSWRVRAIETEPADARPRLHLDPLVRPE
jgi:hypothetical protein